MKQQILKQLPEGYPWKSNLHWIDSTDSTNTQLKAMALDGAPHGTVLIADRQTGGRGRMGRTFQSPGGMGIYMSLLLRPRVPAEQWMHLTCAVAVAACDALTQATGLCPGIKWTNDLVVGKKKLGGILTELVTAGEELCVIIGLGINCSQTQEDFDPQLQDTACSLSMVLGKPVCREAIVAALMHQLQRMDHRLLSDKLSILETYRKNCITLGRDISLIRGDAVRHGHALDIDEDGGLLVRFPDGHTETVNSGEVSVRGMYGYV